MEGLSEALRSLRREILSISTIDSEISEYSEPVLWLVAILESVSTCPVDVDCKASR